jgi:hypothetical protein
MQTAEAGIGVSQFTQTQRNDNYKSWYMPTLHPSFCMRGLDNRYDNPVMNLDSKGKEELFRSHIFSVREKLENIKNER